MNDILDKIQNKSQILQIFKGKFKLPPPLVSPPAPYKSSSKVVVFDLDETLGSFGDLYLLWSGIQHVSPEFDSLDILLEQYPEFIRPGMLQILKMLYLKKLSGECQKIFIYTNNQCNNPVWVSQLMKYFNKKVKQMVNVEDRNEKVELFDKVISAFKIGNTPIELNRTSHKKTYSDLIRCTLLPKNTEICFVDDTEYSRMKQDKVYYILPKPYVHRLTVKEIVERWVQNENKVQEKNKKVLVTSPAFWFNWFSLHQRADSVANRISSDKKQDLLQTDVKVARKLMYSIREFFLLTTFYEKQLHYRKNTKKIRVLKNITKRKNSHSLDNKDNTINSSVDNF